MNVLLALVETLNKPQHSLTETELSNARSDLVELTEAGFKLNWLKTMLDEVIKKILLIMGHKSNNTSRRRSRLLETGSRVLFTLGKDIWDLFIFVVRKSTED
ncbi:hypothetical protein F2Q69_00051537 [Brassica cretica]|uniref:MATH domain-containing protein n=1 Tax=Brassica cretica TaxID=69181 RepID=A0A8S9PLA9_BRACR|nr:hypothetical protein F2Q69_00051537 [Brassica cretica]